MFSTLLPMVLRASAAFAQEAGGAASPAGGPPALLQFAPMIFMVVVLYFLMIRPQSQKAKTHKEFLSTLKRGDQVVTSGGILGSVEGLTDQFITLEIASGVRIKILRSQIASSATAATSTSEVKST